MGDALGNNVVNIALIFGLALVFGPIRVERRELGRDFDRAGLVARDAEAAPASPETSFG